MGVSIAQRNIKFLSELVNGPNFDENLGSFTTTYADAPTGRCLAVSTIEVTVGMNISNFQILYAGADDQSDTNPLYKIVKDDATFIDEGFTLGSNIALTFDRNTLGNTIYNVYLIVTSVTQTELFVTYDGKGDDNDDDISLATLHQQVNSQNNPNNNDINVYSNPGYIAIDPSFTALEFSYNLIENSSGNASLISDLTNTENSIKIKNIPIITGESSVSGVSTSRNKAAVMGGVSVELLDKVYNNNALLQLKFTNRYEVRHEFTVPYYFDGEDDNIADTTTPPDNYNGNSALKYIYKHTWFTDINDPNTGSTSVYDGSLGNSGYFDEAFNGEENPYTVSNLVYFDVDESRETDRLSIGKRTRVNFDITNTDSDFDSSQIAVIVHGAIVDSSEYSSSQDVFDVVWTLETLRSDASEGAVTNVLIQDYEITYESDELIRVQAIFEPNASRLKEDQFYILALQLRNDSEPNVAESHKVHVLVDYNQYGKNNDVEGLFDMVKFEQYPHPELFQEGVSIGFTEALTFNESGMMADGRFWVLNSANLNSLKFDIAVFKFSDSTWDSLRSLVIDLSDQVTVNGVQQIELDTTRGYILKEDDIFNYLKITTDTNDGTKQFYNIQVGYRIPWQSWLEFGNAPEIFYDRSKSHNGLNQKSSNYSMVGTGGNTFTDGDNGTFEDETPANWNITTFGYSPVNPNQICDLIDSETGGNTGGFSAKLSFGAPSMNEPSKEYLLIRNDTGINVVEGVSYEVSSYLAIIGDNTDIAHLDNGSFYWKVDGYPYDEMIFDTFFYTENTSTPTGEDLIWFKTKTTFKATSTGVVNFSFYELLQTDIDTPTGGAVYMDDVTVKEIEYGIKVLFDAVVDLTNYVITSEEIKVFDYDTDDQNPTNFECEIKTFKIDPDDINEIIEIEGNIIEKGYTQFQAIFTPLEEPSFSEPVDMNEVANDWHRFAHGNKHTVFVERLNGPSEANVVGSWDNEQAGEVNGVKDTFKDPSSGAVVIRSKDASDLYDSSTDSITAEQNMSALYGMYSLLKYEYYDISGEMYSNFDDNDAIVYNIAFNIDEQGVEHTLSLCATTGGLLLGRNPSYVLGDSTTDTFEFNPSNNKVKWALVYDFGKRDCRQLVQHITTDGPRNWDDLHQDDQTFKFRVKRSSNDIEVICSWSLPNDPTANATFNINLDDDSVDDDLVKFKREQHIGFSFMSQNLGGFKNVNLTQPQSDFYVEMRIDPKESKTDLSNSRISSHLEAPKSNLLNSIPDTIIDGTNKALLTWDGTSFRGQCLVDTTKVKNGQQYDFSAEIRPINLEKQ